MKGYQAKWSNDNNRWELYVTVYMAPMALIGAKNYIRRVHTDRLRTLPPGDRKEHLTQALQRLEEPDGFVQVLMPAERSKEVVFLNNPMPDDAKTPFSDLGSIRK